MNTFSYRNGDQYGNVGSLIKGGTDKPAYYIDFADGLASGVTISSASAATVNSVNVTVTTLVNTVGVSGTIVTTYLLTGGSGGTGTASDGDEFQITTSAVVSSGGPLIFKTFVRIQNPTYGP